MEPAVRAPKVFICYSKQDMTKASGLFDRLAACGADPWFDKQKLELGDDWELEIKKAVRESDAFVACLRPGFDDIGFRQKEVKWALDALQLRPPGRGFIIPYIVEPCELPSWCEPLHAGADLGQPTDFEVLLRAIEKHCQVTLKRPFPAHEAKVAPEWLSSLASVIAQVLIAVEEFEERSNAPHWATHIRIEFDTLTRQLRAIALDNNISDPTISGRIRALCEKCDQVVDVMRFVHSGTFAQLTPLIAAIGDHALALKTELVDSNRLGPESTAAAREIISGAAARARDLVDRMERLARGRLDELQSEAATIGGMVLNISYFRLDFLSDEQRESLRKAGHELHLVDTMRVFMDGGNSVRAIFKRITDATEKLESIAQVLA